MVYKVRFFGEIERKEVTKNGLTMTLSRWVKGEEIKAMAYDTPIPGYNTFNTNGLRLWSSLPSFDTSQTKYHCKSDDEYVNLIEQRQRAEKITSIFYQREINNPDDKHKESIIKQ